MFNYLTNQNSHAIKLIGHTDPSCSTAHNMMLSENGALALKQSLDIRGYTGAIQTIGRGESEPFQMANQCSYCQEEQHQLHRLLELVRE